MIAKSDHINMLRAAGMVSVLTLACLVFPLAASAEASLADDPTLQNWSAEEMQAELEEMRAEREALSDKERLEKRHDWQGSMTEEKRWMRGLSEERKQELMMMPPRDRAMLLFRERLDRERGDPVERALDHTFGTPRSLGLASADGRMVAQNGGADATDPRGFDSPLEFQGGPEGTRRQGGQRPPRGGKLSAEERRQLQGMSKAERREYMRQRLQNRWRSMSESEKQQFRDRASDNLGKMNPQKRAALAARIQERLSRMTPEQKQQYLQKFEQRLQGMPPEAQQQFRELLPR